jgi:hypothetical protein
MIKDTFKKSPTAYLLVKKQINREKDQISGLISNKENVKSAQYNQSRSCGENILISNSSQNQRKHKIKTKPILFLEHQFIRERNHLSSIQQTNQRLQIKLIERIRRGADAQWLLLKAGGRALFIKG